MFKKPPDTHAGTVLYIAAVVSFCGRSAENRPLCFLFNFFVELVSRYDELCRESLPVMPVSFPKPPCDLFHS